MHSLRANIIRLAHQNPALRPHLLPLLARTAYLALPPVRGSFGFEGPDADEAALRMIAVVRDSMVDTNKEARRTWQKLALENPSSADVEALRKTYLGLYEKVMDYFDALPHPALALAEQACFRPSAGGLQTGPGNPPQPLSVPSPTPRRMPRSTGRTSRQNFLHTRK